MALHETHDFTVPPMEVCGTVPSTNAATILGVPEITSIGGIPPGPEFSVFPPNPGPPKLGVGAIIFYGGKLSRGNHFGQCEAIASGRFQREIKVLRPPSPGGAAPGAKGLFLTFLSALLSPFKSRYRREVVRGTFTVTGKLTIRPPDPPRYAPAAVQVARGAPGPEEEVRVSVTPPCRYDIVFTHDDELPRHLIIAPTMLTTDANGQGVVKVRDAIGQGPRGPITVTGTIHPAGPCVETPLIGEFTVSVQ